MSRDASFWLEIRADDDATPNELREYPRIVVVAVTEKQRSAVKPRQTTSGANKQEAVDCGRHELPRSSALELLQALCHLGLKQTTGHKRIAGTHKDLTFPSAMPASSNSTRAARKSKGPVGSQAEPSLEYSALKVASFNVLPLSLPGSSIRPVPTHYLYLRRHQNSAKSADPQRLPPLRTLFVVNLPVDATERHLRLLFHSAGRIERIDISTVVPSKGQLGVQEDEEEEEEEEEEKENDREGSADDSRERQVNGLDELQEMASSRSKLSRKQTSRRKTDKEQKSRPPPLVPLPNLDPRRSSADYPLLPTGTTAHIVFLEEGSVEKALCMANITSSEARWTDPWEVLLQKQAGKNERERGNGHEVEDDETSRKHKGRPSTALEAAASHLATRDPRPPLGLSLLLEMHDSHRPQLAQVKAHADSVIARYTFFRSHPRYTGPGAGAEELRLASSQAAGIKVVSYGPNGEPLDEDGFTIVLPGAKYGRALGPSIGQGGTKYFGGATVKVARRLPPQEQSAADSERASSKKKSASTEGLEEFYRFQMRERRKERLAEMRKQFDEDRNKVAKLKEQQAQSGRASKGRFRPY